MARDTPPDIPMTFVRSEDQKDVHVFVPESFSLKLVQTIANNFSRRIQQPVKVFHDTYRQKFRLCPLPEGSTVDVSTYDLSEPKPPQGVFTDWNSEDESSKRAPRPRNRWILYRQHHSKALREEYPGITASELSKVISAMWKNEDETGKQFWLEMEEVEERRHKGLYPGYKYTTKKSAKKSKDEAATEAD
ncbi:Mating-type M-specific polypeptide Mc [Cladobotryum mycophilum]|uniref:Mating-type M-specific polypeptide Mc n=1 Tax=Cladobotryum mycophilum TaxID=491253 RepID=A0ABR0T3M1_9HYPO